MSAIGNRIKRYFKTNFQAALRATDVNRDGMVDFNELVSLLQRCGVSYWSAYCEARQIFAELDKNRDGRLSAQDIQGACGNNISQHTLSLIEYLKQVFKNPRQAMSWYDRDQNGYISVGELSCYLQSAGVPAQEATNAAYQLVRSVDKDCDGYVTMRDLCR